MSKAKIIAAVIIVILLLGGLGVGLYLSQRPKEVVPSQAGSLEFVTQTSAPSKKESIYTDTSGFSFKYPSELKVEDITPDDNSYYSMLSMKNTSGGIVVTIKDTTAKTIDAWLKSDKSSPKGATLVSSVTLGGLQAKTYSAGSKLYTVAIDSGVLYLIEAAKDGGYWEKTHGGIVSSFALSSASTSASDSSASSGSSDTIYEEEVIE